MDQTDKLKLANVFRTIARYGLLLISVAVLLFALVSGSQEGGGLKAILQNAPNALPWLILLAASILAWKDELVSGVAVTLIGIGFQLFFLSKTVFFWSTFIVLLIITILGLFLISSWWLRQK